MQRVHKLRQFISHSIPWIPATLWCESHVNIPIWCSTFLYWIWGWENSDILEIVDGIANTKASVAPWGYRDRLGKLWASGED